MPLYTILESIHKHRLSLSGGGVEEEAQEEEEEEEEENEEEEEEKEKEGGPLFARHVIQNKIEIRHPELDLPSR